MSKELTGKKSRWFHWPWNGATARLFLPAILALAAALVFTIAGGRGLLTGSEIWGPGGGGGGVSDFSYLPEPVELAVVPLTSTGTTNVATHASEAGRVVGVFFAVAVLPNSVEDVSGTPDVDMVLTVDGTAYTESIYGSNCADTILPICWSIPFYDSQRYPWGPGLGVPDQSGELTNTKSGFFYNVPYESSIQLDVVVNTVSGGTEVSLDASLMRVTRIAGSRVGRVEGLPRALQPLSSITLNVSQAVATRTTVVNVTESGMLHGIGVHVGDEDVTPGVDCDLEISVDGNLSTQQLWAGIQVTSDEPWIPALQAPFSTQFSFFGSAPAAGGTGGERRDWLQLWYQARYHTSLLVEVACDANGVGSPSDDVVWTVVRSTDL